MTQVHRPDDEAPQTRSAQPAVAAVAIAVAAAILIVLMVVAHAPEPGDTDRPAPATAAPSGPAQPATVGCPGPRPVADPELAAFVGGLDLPAGAEVIAADIDTEVGFPGKIGVEIDLCLPDSAGVAALRPVATRIAGALQPTALGARTVVLTVTDLAPDRRVEARLEDPNFPLSRWKTQPSRAAELVQWHVVTE
ncbi:hypothetical protein [Nocardia farcinica]|uniref:hypothetical protein n=1 Tax=Nocardia farcinica TaxID=37329 RepID=UPI000BF92786|nr:hypothetical protein [Nocardia farcinica]PFX01636.1 hypothetical protein CJ468_06070 [Nocardia farcinica]PFX03279.1 hypothetical protein CJ469_01153 [Nocardia farcinica]